MTSLIQILVFRADNDTEKMFTLFMDDFKQRTQQI